MTRTALFFVSSAVIVCAFSIHAQSEVRRTHLNIVAADGAKVAGELHLSVDGGTWHRRIRFETPAAISVDVPRGPVKVLSVAEGLWSPPLTIGSDPSEINEIRLYATGLVAGRVQLPNGADAPVEVSVRVNSNENQDLKGATIVCPVASNVFSCLVPIGQHDLSFGIKGFARHYRAGIRVVKGGRNDLGKIHFLRGGSLAGFVELPAGGYYEKVLVALISQLDSKSFTARPNGRGFFSISGVPAGQYVLRARHPGLATFEVEVEIRDSLEARPRTSLILDRPAALRLSVKPPLDPNDRPWRVELIRILPGKDTLVAAREVSTDGDWGADALPAGDFRLNVMDSARRLWRAEEIAISGESKHAVSLESVRVEGVVRLGQRGVQARVTFGGERTPNSFSLDTDHEGAFTTTLPRRFTPATRVTISSEVPQISTDFDAVALDDAITGIARLDLELPATSIFGRVFNADGAPASALINIQGPSTDRLAQVNANSDGTFEIVGLPPAEYDLTAMGFMEESRPFRVRLVVEEPAQVTLRMTKNDRLRGRITSDGVGIAGATLHAIPVDVPVAVSFRARSNAEAGTT